MKISIIGRGGHASVVAEACKLLGHETKFIAAEDEKAFLASRPTPDMHLICGIGSVGSQALRRDVLTKFQAFSDRFTNVIHPKATDGAGVRGRGVFLAQGSQVVVGAHVDDHVIVNTGAIVDHDCHLGFATHIATGAVLCGGVRTGAHVHVGANATVLQGVSIPDGCVIGAGSVVTKTIAEPNTVWVGVPAKKIKGVGP